ncbi:porin [Paraburkholderia tropica]|uniref:porin n=1 Tax=Paraburkholderia tropica TaxID=92647 RepID=UPI0007EDC79A|nr:porin [Paraburkholderia tropica]OBR53136.1 porin [Paraburkholderia tropica]
MKAKLCLASAMLGMVSLSASAQSSVTLFGVLDEGLNYTNNVGGKSAWQTSSIDLATSRWGLKGNEDLGAGLHAIFDLESAFSMDNGQAQYGGRLFGYQSYIGLQSDTYGTLTIGRQYDSVTDTIGLATANGNWAGYLFSHPLDNDNTDATFHADNSIKYQSPTIAGLSATGVYGFSNLAGAFATNRMFSVGLKYGIGDFTVGAVYEDLSSPGSTTVGSQPSDDYVTFTARNQKIYGLGATYSLGQSAFGLAYTHVAIQQPTASVYVGSLGDNLSGLRFDNIEANWRYNISPALFVGAMYTYTLAHADEGGEHQSLHWNQVGLMGQYSLSKRTALYTQFVYQKLSGGNTGTPLDTAYIPGSAGTSSNSHQVVARIGINHSF